MNKTGDERVLGCTPGASFEELRSAYLKLARRLHPDKAKGKESEEFVKVQKAWEAIVARAEIQRKLESSAHEVDLDDLPFDKARDAYFHPCRCGDEIPVPCEALENRVEIFACPSCSLRVRVAYEVVDHE